MGSKLRVLEWFSGIGGWSFALRNLSDLFDFEVVAAVDINPQANEVYLLNIGLKPLPRIVESIKIDYLNKIKADVWVMSPPCQPFTRNHERDDGDKRISALTYLTQILGVLEEPPRFIALENVVGFESSPSCLSLLECLTKLGYKYSQFILTPTQFGIPNERPRYFLVASRAMSAERVSICDASVQNVVATVLPNIESIGHSPKTIGKYLIADSSQLHDLFVPNSTLEKTAAWCLDIVTELSQTSSCFTKAYSRFMKGAGSVILVATSTACIDEREAISGPGIDDSSDSIAEQSNCSVTDTSTDSPSSKRKRLIPCSSSTTTDFPNDSVSRAGAMDEVFQQDPAMRLFDANWRQLLGTRQIRYFAPIELLRLFGFPPEFRFPSSMSNRKCYELIGNSVNVIVVTHVLRFMFSL